MHLNSNTTSKQTMNMRLLLILSLGHLVTDLSQGALPILLPFLKQAFTLTYTQVSLAVLVTNMMSSIIQPVFGYFSDKMPGLWLLPLGVLVSGFGLTLAGLSPHFSLTLAAVAVSGLGVAAYHPAASKSAFHASGINKGTGFAIFSVGGNLGFAVGSVFMTYLLTRAGGLSNTIYFMIPSLITALVLWFTFPQLIHYKNPASPKSAEPAVTDSTLVQPKYWPLVILLLIIFVRSTIHAGLTTYIPLYYVSYLQSDATYASVLISVFLAAGVIGTFFGGVLSDKFGRVRIIMLSMLMMLPLLYAFAHSSSSIFTVVLLFMGGAILVATTSTAVVLAQELLPNNVGMASGLTIGFSIGMGGIGVTLLGLVADHSGVPAVFSMLTLLPLAAVALTFLLPKDDVVKHHP